MPGAAAELAVGHPLEADLLMHSHGVANGCVLDAMRNQVRTRLAAGGKACSVNCVN